MPSWNPLNDYLSDARYIQARNMKFLHNEGTRIRSSANCNVDAIRWRREISSFQPVSPPPFHRYSCTPFLLCLFRWKEGTTIVKHALPTVQAARRRFDEHYNIIRIGLALNEVGGARAERAIKELIKSGLFRASMVVFVQRRKLSWNK